MSIPDASLALYEKLIAAVPGAQRLGKSMPYTSRNGHMYSFLAEDGKLCLRLPSDELASFLKQHKTKGTIRHGREMKEYADVPASLLKKTTTLKKYFKISHDYVGSLEPKATKKKTVKKKKAVKKKPTKKTAKKKTAKKRK